MCKTTGSGGPAVTDVADRFATRAIARDRAKRAGLQPSETRYLILSLLFALVGAAVVVIWAPSIERVRPGSSHRQFAGLGCSWYAVAKAFLYGGVQTGFSEELLFRGLIAGSLSRRMPVLWANLIQAFIFLLPHLAIVRFMPEMSWILSVVFCGALLYGWVRIKSGSILGSWLMHASGNVAMALSVAIRSAA